MNTNTKQVSGIVERAMLVDLTVNRYTVSRKDKRVTEEVRVQHSARGEVGSYNKRLWPQDPEEIKAVQKLWSVIQTEHRRMTLPWTQNGWRILPRDMHEEYATTMNRLKREYEQAVKAMAEQLPTLIAGARGALGAMFNEADYPTASEFVASHGVTIKFMPVPDAGDFRIDLDAQTMGDLRSAYEADMKEYLEVATRDAWERLHGVVNNLAQACDRIDDKVAADSDRIVLRRAVIDNVLSMTAILPKLNVTNDPKLEEVRQEVVQKLGRLKVADIKDDLVARAQAKKDANAILSKMAAFLPQQPNSKE